MSKQSFLFELVKGLSPAEKRYFRIQAQRHGSKNNDYEKLFNAIDKQEEYNPEKLYKVIPKKKYSVVKNYLYNFILESLLNYDTKTDYKSRLDDLFSKARLLHDRGLYTQCEDLIRKGQKMATDQLAYKELFDFNYLEIMLMGNNKSKRYSIQEVEGRYEEQKEVLRQMGYQLEIKMVQKSIMKYMNSYGTYRSDEEREHYQQKISSLLFEEAGRHGGDHTRLLYHYVRAVHHTLQSNRQGSLEEMEKAWQFRERYRKDDPRFFVSMAHNYMMRLALGDKMDRVMGVLKDLETLGPLNRDTETIRFQTYYTFLLAVMLDTGDTSAQPDFSEKLKADLEEQAGRANPVFMLNMMCQAASLNFVVGNMDESWYWLDRFINHPKREIHGQVLAAAMVLQLVLFIEQGETDLYASRLRAYKKAMNADGRYPKFLKGAYALLKVLEREPDRETQKEAYLKFARLFEQLKKDPDEQPVTTMFNFGAWATARAEGSTMTQVLAAL